ncbi:MAG TPA: serine/threonine-protein kinase [Polyangiaceae bacterium]|jgi:tetratricopeptide (TPR) repeat protein/tRNA A-37 threonylcarbamoyl transferase component Bud32
MGDRSPLRGATTRKDGEREGASVTNPISATVDKSDTLDSAPTASIGAWAVPRLEPVDAEPIERIGRYMVIARIGGGAMGQVYSTYDPELDRRIAVKLLRASGADSEDMRVRLFREAQAMARLTHPNVVTVYDVGVSNGRVFIAMELSDGVTLKQWRQGAHSWREQVRMHVAAGRGLAAAHAAGIVHHDFKPDNVLVSKAGVVKVTDFGIAHGRHAEAESAPPSTRPEASRSVPPPPASSGRSLVGASLTEAGAMMGTPGYMAPEQYSGAPTDPRTDQFSFCVTLYEALYGERPFNDSSFEAQMAAVCDGRIRPLKRKTKVPARIRRILLRGLRREPSERYPDMETLLAELQRDRTRAVLASSAAALVVLGVVGAVVVARRSAANQQALLCSGGGPLVHEVWNPQIEESLGGAFQRSGVSYAAEAWEKARQGLDAYAERWADAHHAACEATRVRGVQTEGAMQLRMTCLEQRRRALGALARKLSSPDEEGIGKATQAVYSLPDIDDCADATALTSVEPLPAAPAVRAQIDQVQRELSELRAVAPLGQVDVLVPEARALRERARATGYAPVTADVAFELGSLLHTAGDEHAVEVYKEAIVAAEHGRADDVKVGAESSLAHLLANQHRFEEADEWLSLGRATASHSDRRLEARLSKVEAWLAFERDDFEHANAAFRKALDAYAEFYPRSPDYALAMSGAATVALLAGEPARAMDLSARSDTLAIDLFGAGSTFRAGILSNRAAVLLEAARYDEALAAADAALELSAGLPPTQNRVMMAHFNRIEALLGLDRVEEARAALETEMTVLRARGVDTSRDDYGRRWSRLEGKVLVMTGEYKQAIATLAELLPKKTGSSAEEDQDSTVEAPYGEALLRSGSPKLAAIHLRAALDIMKAEKISTPARMEEVADAKLLLAEALFEAGDAALGQQVLREVAASALPSRRRGDFERMRARPSNQEGTSAAFSTRAGSHL